VCYINEDIAHRNNPGIVEAGIMIRVLIVCSWGMSTSLLVESMLEAAKERQCELHVEALSAGEYAAKVEEYDVVLIAPQIRHLRKSIEKLAQTIGKPVALIEPFHYATMNGQAVLEQVLRMINGA
jgi:PTS system cellobiose-specific IIB component